MSPPEVAFSVPAKTPLDSRLTFVLLAFVYLYAFPYFGKLKQANEMPRIGLTMEIVERGTFTLDALVNSSFFGSQFDLSRTPDGHAYSNKAPGLSFLAVPVYVVLKAFGVKSLAVITWCFRVFVVTLPVLGFLWWFRRAFARFGDDENARASAFAALTLASPVLPYSLQFMSHAIAAATAATAFVLCMRLVRDRPRHAGFVASLAGFFAASTVVLEYQGFISAFPVAVYLLLRSPVRRRDVPLFAAGTVPPGLLLGYYHLRCFGSPFRTGYSFHSTVFNEGVFGTIGPNRLALHHTLTDPANGLFMLTPWVVLAIVGGVCVLRDSRLRSRVGAEAIACIVIAGGYVLYLGSLVPWFARAGWTVGPRHMLVAFPFLSLLASAGFSAVNRVNRPVAGPLAATLGRTLVWFSAVVFLVAGTTYPHWPDALRNPLFELSFRLLANGRAVHSLGTVLGLKGLVSLVPVFVVAFLACWRLLGTGRARRFAPMLASCATATILLMAYARFPSSGAYAERAWNFVISTWEP